MGGEAVLRLDGLPHNGKKLSGQESMFVQFATLECFPRARAVFSHWHAGPGALSFGSNRRQTVDLTLIEVDESGRTVVNALNYHGIYFHQAQRHLKTCPKRRGDEEFYSSVNDDDEMKRGLADALSAVEESTVFTYRWFSECDVNHSRRCPHPTTINSKYLDQTSVRHDYRDYGSIEDFLEVHHPEDSLRNPAPFKLSQDDIVDRILKSSDNEFRGFVYLTGGREKDEPFQPSGLPCKAQGYCYSRGLVTEKDLGEFTRYQAKELNRTVKPFNLKKYVGTDLTVLRRSFGSDGECITTNYFRFLVETRGLHGYTIVHLIVYNYRKFLDYRFTSILNERHLLKKTIHENPHLIAVIELIKLFLNGFFGISALEATNFPKISLSTDQSLTKFRKISGEWMRAIEDPNIFNIEFVSALTEPGGKPGLLYTVARHTPDAKIFNGIQVAGTILGTSRVNFLPKIHVMQSRTRRSSFQLCYVDTDSAICLISERTIRDTLIADTEAEKDSIMASLMEDPESDTHQAGLFKIEGVFQAGRFKAVKTYQLTHPVDSKNPPVLTRMLGVTRKIHDQMDGESFSQDVSQNTKLYETVNLKATMSHVMTLMSETRSFNHPLNLKRKQVVSQWGRFFKNKTDPPYLLYFLGSHQLHISGGAVFPDEKKEAA